MSQPSSPPPHLPADRSSLEGLEWPRLMAALQGLLATPMGRQALDGHPFYSQPQPAMESAQRVGDMMALRARRGGPSLGGARQPDEWLARATKGGRLETDELAGVVALQRAVVEAKRLLAGDESPRLKTLAAQAQGLPEMEQRLAEALTPELELNEAVFPELAHLKGEIAKKREALQRMLEGLLTSPTFSLAVQEKLVTLRGSRYVIPVKADFKGRLPGIVHDISASGQTLYLEPEAAIQPANQIAMLERSLGQLEDKILHQLTALVAAQAPVIAANGQWVGQVDLLNAMAALAGHYRGTPALVGQEGLMDLKGLGHPLMLLDGVAVVANDLALGGETRCLIISGANTGGKTVLLKAAGLAALLARFGMPVPAKTGSRVDLFPLIHADIGDRQDISHSLSTFSAQITRLAEVLTQAGPDSLVLVDEMLTGTEPAQGAALARASLEALVRRRAVVLVTTHYGALKRLAGQVEGFANAAVAFSLENLAPTYRMATGQPGSSYAFPIARRYGLSDELVAHAQQLLEEGEEQYEHLLEQMNLARQELEEARDKANALTAELARRRAELERKEEEQARREIELKRQERGKLSQEANEARKEMAALLAQLRRAKQLEGLDEAALEEARRQLDGLTGQALAGQAEKAAQALKAVDWKTIKPGDPVYLAHLGQGALLDTPPGADGQARVRLGAMVLEVEASQLKKPPPGASLPPGAPAKRQGPTPGAGRHAGRKKQAGGPAAPLPPEAIPYTPQGLDNCLDLRGVRVEEGLELLDRFLDQAMVRGLQTVVIIHGYGTGKMMEGVRKALDHNRLIAGWRPGEPEEGAGGVSVAALNL